jgi:hypothetical protein
MQHYDNSSAAQDRRPARLTRHLRGSLSSAGFSWQGSKIRDWTSYRPSEWSSFWFSTVQAATPPAKLKGRGQPQQLAGSLLPLEIATGGEATTGAGIVQSRLSRLLHTYGAAYPPLVQQDLVQRSHCSDGIDAQGLRRS